MELRSPGWSSGRSAKTLCNAPSGIFRLRGEWTDWVSSRSRAGNGRVERHFKAWFGSPSGASLPMPDILPVKRRKPPSLLYRSRLRPQRLIRESPDMREDWPDWPDKRYRKLIDWLVNEH